jgi:hypothetical protein
VQPAESVSDEACDCDGERRDGHWSSPKSSSIDEDAQSLQDAGDVNARHRGDEHHRLTPLPAQIPRGLLGGRLAQVPDEPSSREIADLGGAYTRGKCSAGRRPSASL